jgi:hypothetical protein
MCETWVIGAPEEIIYDALSLHSFEVCHEVFLYDVARATLNIFQEASIDAGFVLAGEIPPPTSQVERLPGLYNFIELHSGPLDNTIGRAFLDPGNLFVENNSGFFNGKKMGVDLYEISLLYFGNSYRDFVRVVATVIAHEVGHNIGFGHSSSGIMAPTININDPPCCFTDFILQQSMGICNAKVQS